MDSTEADFARWEATPPPELFGDAIWRLPAYRISRFLAHVVRVDAERVRARSGYLADQLERSVDSVGINITEGYGRLHGRERARFFEFALGSAREARDWYARAADWLGNDVAVGRAKLLTRAIRILTVAIPQERAGSSERRMRAAAESRMRAREASIQPVAPSIQPPAPAPAPVPANRSSTQH